MHIALAAVLAMTAAPPAAPPPGALQGVAARALSGQYGRLQPWQREGYHLALANGSEPRTFVLTGYGPYEPGQSGRVDRRGAPLHSGVLACNRLPYGTFVYLPSWGRLFVVRDCGARSNDRHRTCRRTGGTWADVYLRSPRDAWGRCDWSPTAGWVVR